MIIYSRLCIGIRPFSPRLLHSLFSSSSNQTPIAQPSYLNVPIGDLKNHLTQILKNQGHDSHSSNVITDTILYAELRNNNQGIVKVIAGALKPNPAAGDISTVFETPVSCQIDGNQQIGMVVVKKCTDIAIQKAKISGVCIVGCSNYSSATGALGVWAREISRNGLISIVMSQCPEMVAPCGSFEPIFGNRFNITSYFSPLCILPPTNP